MTRSKLSSSSYSIFTIANWFTTQKQLSLKKLQILCYYIEAWGQALLNESIINDDYFQIKNNNIVSMKLLEKYQDFEFKDIPKNEEFYNSDLLNNDKVMKILNSVWLTYGEKSTNELSALIEQDMIEIQKQGTSSSFSTAGTIVIEDMKKYYLNLYQNQFE